jgi:UDP-GlcNAc:undecaprenyl-phosphate GlcNAc-1-phosphate transferase
LAVDTWSGATLLKNLAGVGHGGGSSLILVAASLAATIATILICAKSAQLGAITKLIDRPDLGRKLHLRDTPIVGGLAVMVPTLLLSVGYVMTFPAEPFLLAATFASSVILAIGVLDDRLDLSPAWRFTALFYVVFVAFSVEPQFVVHSVGINFFGTGIEVPFHSLAGPITLLMIVGFANATNMADGMNGQLLGSLVIWALLLLHYIGKTEVVPIVTLFCCAAVALCYNLNGRLFSGSGGAYSGAVFIALCTIAVYRSTPNDLPAQTVAMWFWLPVVDCLRLMLKRMAAFKSPFAGDRDHIHHALLSLMRPSYALAVYLLLLGLPGVMTIFSKAAGELSLVCCVIAYVLLIYGRRADVPMGYSNAIQAGE